MVDKLSRYCPALLGLLSAVYRGKHLQAAARIAGYSALHPEHRLYRSFLYCQTSTEIQTAPLVELEN